ncbi:linear amide C-N hydrolase [Cerasicoccus arenae]|uniref:Choloylglycine hydrolase n=1 Tax=Cerasicoccus arenae TaxID=424488 RepID=A0A8J3GF16_9BACT|nr:linear amide C-N hydrolase [Cerasicoccus arenae]MBK1858908.1 linear amide C-N hydrolase [Cerasicoccus arenae]GHC08118.1 choloylglycine hydrolase [Cerasicoccus arenae]
MHIFNTPLSRGVREIICELFSQAKKISFLATAVFLTGSIFAPSLVNACTRAMYVGGDGTVITGRSMDWMQDMETDLWVFPRGMERNGNAGSDSPTWTSKYGSVIASAYNIASADGINEKGLVANMLYLAEAEYGDDTKNPPLSIGLWAQYVLDNYANVNEVVDGLTEKPLRIVAPKLPNGSAATLHLSVSDPSGDSAIFEYLNGKLTVHHGKEYKVMTNSPVYDQQLALDTYWNKIGGMSFLPGTNSAADRYVRASFFMDAVTKKLDSSYIADVPNQTYAHQAVGQTLSVIRSVSVPLGIVTPGQPNIASTLWRTVADQANMVYFFDSSTTPDTFWVPLKDMDFSKTAKPKKLPIAGGHYYSGNAAEQFVEAKPFTFMKAEPAKTK